MGLGGLGRRANTQHNFLGTHSVGRNFALRVETFASGQNISWLASDFLGEKGGTI